MHDTSSRAHPKGGSWKTAVVSAIADTPPAGTSSSNSEGASSSSSSSSGSSGRPTFQHLELYVSSGDSSSMEDRPPGGGSYRLCQPGGFKLRSGQLRPFPSACAPSVMLVSDLDGTMVGEGEDADAATADFGFYWEENAALAGSVLVYNTGRSIGQFLGLLEAKQGALPVPDVVISAVGTKVRAPGCWRGCGVLPPTMVL